MDENKTSHTKRSETFDKVINGLYGKLAEDTPLTVEDRTNLMSILISNTTDSPCVVKARYDEPLFVLRGQDKFAPALVLAWAQLYDQAAAEREYKPELVYQGTPRSQDAAECAETMAMYHTRKYPD